MRTAPIGPSNGMPEIISAAEAALIESTSCGLCWSAPSTVVTIWVSLRKPSGNDGRSGRSVRRQVRIASSVGRPSRRKNEPGILPAAYDRSSTSTVNGKKSMPGRTSAAALAVVSTRVSPMVARTAPWLCGASLPVSNESVRSVPEMGPETRMGSATNGSFRTALRAVVSERPGSVPSWQLRPPPHPAHRAAAESATGNRRRCRSVVARTVTLVILVRAADVPQSAREPTWSAAVCRAHPARSAAEAELGDQLAVALDVDAAEVVEHATPTADEHQQAAAAVVILGVHLEVLGEVLDAIGEER